MKAAGGCPAAPMRQRSCRGAGSTTAALAQKLIRLSTVQTLFSFPVGVLPGLGRRASPASMGIRDASRAVSKLNFCKTPCFGSRSRNLAVSKNSYEVFRFTDPAPLREPRLSGKVAIGPDAFNPNAGAYPRPYPDMMSQLRSHRSSGCAARAHRQPRAGRAGA
jgi:hypothetical protein